MVESIILLGWEIAASDMGGSQDYRTASINGEMVAGIMPMPPEAGEMPSYSSVYRAVDDCWTSAKRDGFGNREIRLI